MLVIVIMMALQCLAVPPERPKKIQPVISPIASTCHQQEATSSLQKGAGFKQEPPLLEPRIGQKTLVWDLGERS